MGLLENFSKNVGGLRGGLLSAGQMFGAMAQSLAAAPPGQSGAAAWGGALGVGNQALQAGFDEQKGLVDDREFKQYAQEQLRFAEPGSNEALFWDAVASGNDAQRRLLPSLMQARSADARTKRDAENEGRPSGPQRARNKKIRADRRRLIMNPGMIGRMSLSDPGSMRRNAMNPLVNEPDPEHERYHSYLSQNTFLQGAGGIPWGRWNLIDPETGEYGLIPDDADDATDSDGADAEDDSGGLFARARSFFGLSGDDEEGAAETPGTFGSRLSAALGETAAIPEVPIVVDSAPEAAPQAFFAPAAGGSGPEPQASGTRGMDLAARSDSIREQATKASLLAIEGLKRKGLLGDDFSVPAATGQPRSAIPQVPNLHESALTRGLMTIGDTLSGRLISKRLARERARGLYGQ